ncbi:hypothetical protein DERP_002029 [Dermatophagoides pteronyssinus]|uniref:Uncharacterized protein n=1 Tax=Dermatophagoides pteronyssinus TaxID=6956 RepID=A0ABQ8JH13_DERPT|nr:hypothetical protein DERP_002029 [Dermatophagoides pteronyssinus]
MFANADCCDCSSITSICTSSTAGVKFNELITSCTSMPFGAVVDRGMQNAVKHLDWDELDSDIESLLDPFDLSVKQHVDS